MQGRQKEVVLWSIAMVIFLILLVFVHKFMTSPLPESVSTFSGDIDAVFYVIYYITGFAFILVTTLLIWFLIRYRHQPGQRALYTHGSTALELAWTITPAAVFIILFLISQVGWARIKIFSPPGDVDVRLIAKQFSWTFHYPGPDGKFDTADDKPLGSDLHVPVNKVVRVHLQSEDVIHSFFVPVFRLKQDAVPGREIVAWFEATKPGRYEIPCAELCGIGHSGMKGWLTVYTAEDYQKWVQAQWPAPPPQLQPPPPPPPQTEDRQSEDQQTEEKKPEN
jgi:cytochrome c oxidase subunit 2